MTREDEIREAMLDGASTMFLIGLLTLYRNSPEEALGAINAAGERVRREREVRIKTPDVTLIELVERQWM